MKTFRHFISEREAKHYPPQKFLGKPLKELGFSVWLRSEREVMEAIKEKLGNKTSVIANIATLYGDFNYKVDEPVIMMYPKDEIWEFREYDRGVFWKIGNDQWNGRDTLEEYQKLEKSILAKGIKEPLIMSLTRKSTGLIEVYLSEGNTRLAIARQHSKIKTVPIRFLY